MIEWLIFPIYFVANMIQGAAGFGSALVAMPLLITLLGLQVAAPLFALTGVLTALILLIRYRTAFRFGHIWRILLGTIVGIPVGIVGAQVLDETLVLSVLGIFTICYALYGLSGADVPKSENRLLPFGAGIVAGLLAGAYNTSGPPFVIYGDSQGWQPDEFKSNLQGLFLVATMVTTFSHFVGGHLTIEILVYAIIMIPVIIAGAFLGSLIDRFIKPETFRKGVLMLLIILGLTLIF